MTLSHAKIKLAKSEANSLMILTRGYGFCALARQNQRSDWICLDFFGYFLGQCQKVTRDICLDFFGDFETMPKSIRGKTFTFQLPN